MASTEIGRPVESDPIVNPLANLCLGISFCIPPLLLLLALGMSGQRPAKPFPGQNPPISHTIRKSQCLNSAASLQGPFWFDFRKRVGFVATFADGHTEFFPKGELSEAALRALITRNGGEKIDRDELP